MLVMTFSYLLLESYTWSSTVLNTQVVSGSEIVLCQMPDACLLLSMASRKLQQLLRTQASRWSSLMKDEFLYSHPQSCNGQRQCRLAASATT